MAIFDRDLKWGVNNYLVNVILLTQSTDWGSNRLYSCGLKAADKYPPKVFVKATRQRGMKNKPRTNVSACCLSQQPWQLKKCLTAIISLELAAPPVSHNDKIIYGQHDISVNHILFFLYSSEDSFARNKLYRYLCQSGCAGFRTLLMEIKLKAERAWQNWPNIFYILGITALSGK